MALQGIPRADDLAILIDSAAAIQRLRLFRSHDFQPAEHKVQDYDIIHNILLELKLRSDSSSRTLFVKVHGHSGDPLHEEADRLAVEGADIESDNKDTLYPGGRGQEMVFNWVDDADKSKLHTWCLSVKKHIKAHEEMMSWQIRSQKSHAKEFLERPNAELPQLGVVFRVSSKGLTHESWRKHFFILFWYAATQLARQVHRERTQVMCSNKVAQKRLARRHSRNGLQT